ncbi:hypothetical protein ACMX2H_18645 [Arthrobacter sulfonylureivorans]|uniref:hypothetical protein n=1 Tax=Arthrobacter sulfonylureivorans TaxID=2486855 RepID=UPI0039E6BDA5
MATPQLMSTTAILSRPVRDLQEFAGSPADYLEDLYEDPEAAARTWLRVGEPHRFQYNDGVVSLAWQGIPLLGMPVWDDVCGIWRGLVAVIADYSATTRGETLLPDQPVSVVLERIRGGALLTVGETAVRVDPTAFNRQLLAEAERFWQWTEQHGIPVDAPAALQDIARARTVLDR